MISAYYAIHAAQKLEVVLFGARGCRVGRAGGRRRAAVRRGHATVLPGIRPEGDAPATELAPPARPGFGEAQLWNSRLRLELPFDPLDDLPLSFGKPTEDITLIENINAVPHKVQATMLMQNLDSSGQQLRPTGSRVAK